MAKKTIETDALQAEPIPTESAEITTDGVNAPAEITVGATGAATESAEITTEEADAVTASKAKNPFFRFGGWCARIWKKFKAKHPLIAQFLVFFIMCNGVTVLQLILMPAFKALFGLTSLVDINFQILQIGKNLNGTNYYVFDYGAGSLKSGGGGGLAYFLAVQVTIGIAQVINFFAQRNITFKSDTNPWWPAMWYLIAYVAITILAGALQGLYKAPIYKLFMTTWGWGGTGETLADIITMILNSAIAFWVFFPIFKVIFKQKKDKAAKN